MIDKTEAKDNKGYYSNSKLFLNSETLKKLSFPKSWSKNK
jgi:hypothetical protein